MINQFIKILRLKDQGRVGPTTGGEDNYFIGYNFKFTNLQASLGLSQLDSIEKRVKLWKATINFIRRILKKIKILR